MATNNNDKTLNVPPLRFPEFTGEWRYSFLNEYLEENKERNKKGLFDKTTVLSVSGDFGIVNQIRLLGRSFAGKSVLDYHVVRYGNIVYTKSPLKEYPYGIVKINNGVDGIVSTLYAVYNVKSNASGCFIENYFALPRRTNKYFKPIVRIGAKHDMKISNEEAIANVVCFPQYAEQQKIAEFLSLIDDRIVSQNKIIEKLESLIRGLCLKLVSQGIPNTTLNTCLECHSSILQEKSVTTDGKYPVYGAAGICGYSDTPEASGDSILIIKDGASVGATFYVSGKYSAIGTLNRLTARPGCSLRYLYYCLKIFDFSQYKTGQAIPHIYFRDYGIAKIWCPSLAQQEHIAGILTSIDTKIQMERSLLEHLTIQKRFLLRNMFI